ncbi:MAG: hypothetical protein QXQ02_06665, partial [Halobacteria archaeon]
MIKFAQKQKPKNHPNLIMPKTVRKPAVAGSFYPASRQELDKQLTFYFNQTKIIDSEKLLRILIV